MIKSVLEHLIGRGKRIDVTRSCAFVIQAITLVWRVTTEGKSREIPLLARVLCVVPGILDFSKGN
jgi:hypothetical protein